MAQQSQVKTSTQLLLSFSAFLVQTPDAKWGRENIEG